MRDKFHHRSICYFQGTYYHPLPMKSPFVSSYTSNHYYFSSSQKYCLTTLLSDLYRRVVCLLSELESYTSLRLILSFSFEVNSLVSLSSQGKTQFHYFFLVTFCQLLCLPQLRLPCKVFRLTPVYFLSSHVILLRLTTYHFTLFLTSFYQILTEDLSNVIRRVQLPVKSTKLLTVLFYICFSPSGWQMEFTHTVKGVQVNLVQQGSFQESHLRPVSRWCKNPYNNYFSFFFLHYKRTPFYYKVFHFIFSHK